jgi:hypothetical protein
MGPYRLRIREGYRCWLVMLTDPDPRHWKVLASAKTEEEAVTLAMDIWSGVVASKTDPETWDGSVV